MCGPQRNQEHQHRRVVVSFVQGIKTLVVGRKRAVELSTLSADICHSLSVSNCQILKNIVGPNNNLLFLLDFLL